jgi:hypothetical protein
VLGIDVDQIRSKVQNVVSDVETTVDKGIDTVVSGATQLYNAAATTVTQTVQNVENAAGQAVNTVKKVAQTFTPGAPSGPMQSDCKPVHGQVPGPPEHLLCQTHGHILDVNSGQIIAASLADYKKLSSAGSGIGSAISSAASSVLDTANSVGKTVMNAESAAWDGTKSAYNAVTGAYDAVAPDFNKSNKDLGQLVDAGEALAKKGNDEAAAQLQGVPVLGTLAKAAASVSNVTTDALGGVIKGVGDLTTMAGNAFVHPIDAAGSLAEGALGIAEHVPLVPGLNTTVKGVHGLVDLAEGKKDGEYGSTLSDLGENLLLDTKQDPNDPSKRTNADVDFLAGLGGGTKAWSEKPAEAATRTLTNLAPMLLGDEPGTKPGEPPIPENGPPKVVDPLAKTQVDPLGKTQLDPNGKTLDLGKTQPDAPGQGPQADVDPANPDANAPKGSPEEVFQKARQDLVKAAADQKAAQEANMAATKEYLNYGDNNPTFDLPGADPSKWDPVVNEALNEQAKRAGEASREANERLQAAQRAFRDADAARARAARGGGAPS